MALNFKRKKKAKIKKKVKKKYLKPRTRLAKAKSKRG